MTLCITAISSPICASMASSRPGAGFDGGRTAHTYGFGYSKGGLTFPCALFPEILQGRQRLGELETFKFDVGGAEVGQVVVSLLGEPRFGAAAENLGQSDGHLGRNTALTVDQFGEGSASDTQSGGCLGDHQT